MGRLPTLPMGHRVPAQQWAVYLDAMEVGCGGIGRVWKWLWKDKWDSFERKGKVVVREKNDENSDKDDSIVCQTHEQKMKWHGYAPQSVPQEDELDSQ